MSKPETTEPPVPIPGQTTIDNQPVCPPCRTADYDEARRLVKRTAAALKKLKPGMSARAMACLNMELEETPKA